MRHVAVYKQDGVFAGWPANHGHWQWGNEFLVGFMIGRHDIDGNNAGHAIDEPYTKMLARSRDGGETWSIEKPNVDFNCLEPGHWPPFDLLDPNTIIRVCGVYDTGGEDCHREGGFYLSTDRGHEWQGPYLFHPARVNTGLHNTSRTCVLGNRVFLSFAKQDQWGTDHIVEMAHSNRFGFRFQRVVIEDNHRAVMPAVAYLPTMERTVLVCRRRGWGKNWIDVFGHGKNGGFERWKQLSADPIADTGFANGNPPALVAVNDVLYCAYGNRTDRVVRVIESRDGGTIWEPTATLAASPNRDLGYPRLFKRDDGKLVCVYYISDGAEPNRIEACIFDPKAVGGQ